jgi:hypothetical protein
MFLHLEHSIWVKVNQQSLWLHIELNHITVWLFENLLYIDFVNEK